jgi:hypothetical protein
MAIGIIILIVVIVGAVFVSGLQAGSNASPTTITLPGSATADGCAQACVAWDNARQMECNAKADEAAARSRADAIRTQMLAFVASAVSLGIAGGATLAAAGAATATIFGIPLGIILTAIAVSLFVLAAAAFLYADFLAGQLVSAEADATNKSAARNAWSTAVANARAQVNKNCSPAEANACLSRTAPC